MNKNKKYKNKKFEDWQKILANWKKLDFVKRYQKFRCLEQLRTFPDLSLSPNEKVFFHQFWRFGDAWYAKSIYL